MSEQHNNCPDPAQYVPWAADKEYALSSKIMLSSVVILFAAVVIMAIFYTYTRWYLHRQRHLRHRPRSQAENHLMFTSTSPRYFVPTNRPLDPSVLKSLPTFIFTEEAKWEENFPECAVCLSKLEEGESGRFLPRCGHFFHVDCIDMWFHSHSTCPLCRSSVAAPDIPPLTIDPSPPPEIVVVDVFESSSPLDDTVHGLSVDCSPCPSVSGSSSKVGRMETLAAGGGNGISIEIPARSVGFSFTNEEEYKSPTTRLISLIMNRPLFASTSSSVNSIDTCEEGSRPT